LNYHFSARSFTSFFAINIVSKLYAKSSSTFPQKQELSQPEITGKGFLLVTYPAAAATAAIKSCFHPSHAACFRLCRQFLCECLINDSECNNSDVCYLSFGPFL